MAELKTRPTDANVDEYLAEIADSDVRVDAQRIDAIMREVTGEAPVMWGSSIIGYGTCYLTYASGRELDWPVVGFAPRKTNLTVYLMEGFDTQTRLLAKLGKHSTGKVCLYIKKLADVDVAVLTELIEMSVEYVRARYGSKQEPAVAKKKPAVAKKKPAVAKKKPAVAKKKPAVAKKKPAVAKKKPAAKKR